MSVPLHVPMSLRGNFLKILLGLLEIKSLNISLFFTKSLFWVIRTDSSLSSLSPLLLSSMLIYSRKAISSSQIYEISHGLFPHSQGNLLNSSSSCCEYSLANFLSSFRLLLLSSLIQYKYLKCACLSLYFSYTSFDKIVFSSFAKISPIRPV